MKELSSYRVEGRPVMVLTTSFGLRKMATDLAPGLQGQGNLAHGIRVEVGVEDKLGLGLGVGLVL